METTEGRLCSSEGAAGFAEGASCSSGRAAGFAEMVARLKSGGVRRRVALVCPDDDHTLYVLKRAVGEGVADFTLFCGRPLSGEAGSLVRANGPHMAAVSAESPDEAARAAVEAVRSGGADLLMKGTINTDNLLRAVLDKQKGLLEPGKVLTHVALAELPGCRNRMLAFSDAAVIPYPTLAQYDSMVRHLAAIARIAGAEVPRIALVHCTEKVSEKFPLTLDYETLMRRAAHGDYGKVEMDGPMDVKTALDTASGDIKGLHSPVVGRADALVFPDIEAANVFYKTITLFAQANMAGVLCGTTVPVVVASRADSGESKYNSLALACALAGLSV